MECIAVISPGMLSTVQDLGRPDYLIYGVSACGAMDSYALRLANLLVGNDEDDAAIEITLLGPKLRFLCEGVFAVTGGDLSAQLNGKRIARWKSISFSAGDELDFGHAKEGCRAYIAVRGGIDVPKVMGSRSTFIRGEYGGVGGRALKSGDVLLTEDRALKASVTAGRFLPDAYRPAYGSDRPIRFIRGPQVDAFTDASFEMFISATYTVSPDSDRMGYRLQGATLPHIAGADIVSDFITMGSIQVPGNGQPIVLMADCQVTGGYTKIGVVIGVDLPYLAQKKPGDKIRFEPVAIDEAQRQWRERERVIAMIRSTRQL